MGVSRTWWVILVVIAACTCGARTECGETVQISFLTSVHDDPACTKLSTRGVTFYEAAKLFAEIQNNKTDGFKIEITVLDTCGSITGALKAVMKALVWADISCLHPPHYLGIIGPDTMTNAEAVHKVTSILKVPHIVKKASISPYLHSLTEESNSYLIQGILKMIKILKWKSFTLVANVNDENDDDVQNIAKKLTINAIANNLCVIIHDNNEEDYTSHIIHIGKPEEKFFNEPKNATILIISEGNLKDYLNRMNSSNTILLLEDSRNVINNLEWRVKNSRWWAPNNGFGNYDAKELKQVRWLENAIEIYVKALKAICKNKKCKNQINSLDWDHMVSNVLMTHNVKSEAAPKFLDLSMKKKTSNLERLGGIIVRQNRTQVYWGDSKADEKEEDVTEETEKNHRTPEDNGDVSRMFRELLKGENEPRSGCAIAVKEIEMLNEKNKEATQILVSGMDDNEWWTMVWTVSGIGIAMFLLGILAVYVIYANVRGPKCASRIPALSLFFDVSARRGASDFACVTTATSLTYPVVVIVIVVVVVERRERAEYSVKVMQFRQPAIWLFKLLSIGFAYTGISDWDACSGRLERALDALHRDSSRRNKLDEEEAGTLYQRELHSAPLEMAVSRMAVKLPENTKEPEGQWARVEQCVYDPDRSSLRTRVVFNDLSVSGMVSLIPRDRRAPISAESCRMTLRLRRAGIDFLTSPIARGRGQMRIRTESSFLEPRFASIYAYGCRSTRIDKQIKRQDKWPPYHSASVNKLSLPLVDNDNYDAAEPRQLAGNAEEMDIVIPNESRHPRYSHAPGTNFGIWRKNSWITKSSPRRRRSMARYARTAMVITPRDFADALINGRKSTERPENFTKILNLTDNFRNEEPPQNVTREVRELVVEDNLFPIDSEDPNRSWQSKEYITREMEDVFLQGASQALTRYIERQLHPAIKETLMLSMGYTISYG